jgi:hypothetical protein
MKKLLWGFGIFVGVLFILNITGFCFRQGKYISKEHYSPRKDYIINYLAEHGMAKKIYDDPDDNRQYRYDEDDIESITQKVNIFFKENPQNMRINRYQIFDTSEAYSSYLVYFFSPNEIEIINKYAQDENHFNKFKRKIVGISYWQSYSSCGHPTFGMQDDIYEGDKDDLKFNPYRKHKISKEQ